MGRRVRAATLFVSASAAHVLALAAEAQEWTPLDARSRSLGGAGVAFAEGPGAGYWNAAALASGSEKPFDFSTGWGSGLSVGADTSLEGNVIDDVFRAVDLYDFLDLQGIQSRFTAGTPTAQDVQDAVRIVDAVLALDQPGEGTLTHVGTGIDIRFGSFGLFTRAVGVVAVDPVVDFTGAAITTPANGETPTGTDSATLKSSPSRRRARSGAPASPTRRSSTPCAGSPPPRSTARPRPSMGTPRESSRGVS